MSWKDDYKKKLVSVEDAMQQYQRAAQIDSNKVVYRAAMEERF